MRVEIELLLVHVALRGRAIPAVVVRYQHPSITTGTINFTCQINGVSFCVKWTVDDKHVGLPITTYSTPCTI